MNHASTYTNLHSKLRRTRGSARLYTCAECGNQAAQWAYDRKDPDEHRGVQIGNRTVTYSPSVDHYEPLCIPCHHLRDSPPKDVCKRGHKIEGDNVYVRPNGGRLCRRETQRAWREANPGWREGVYA